jgi:hypothetical protein
VVPAELAEAHEPEAERTEHAQAREPRHRVAALGALAVRVGWFPDFTFSAGEGRNHSGRHSHWIVGYGLFPTVNVASSGRIGVNSDGTRLCTPPPELLLGF